MWNTLTAMNYFYCKFLTSIFISKIKIIYGIDFVYAPVNWPPWSPTTRGGWWIARQLSSLFTLIDIVATVLGKFEVDLPQQSWLWGKLPLFNQLVVATVSRGGVIAVNCRRKVKYPLLGEGGGGGCGYVVVVIGPLAKVSLGVLFLRNTTTSKVSLASNKSHHGSQKVLPSCLIVRSWGSLTVLPSCHFAKVVLFPFFWTSSWIWYWAEPFYFSYHSSIR